MPGAPSTTSPGGRPAAAPARAEMSKEEKKAMRAKQESDVQEALMGAGLTPDQVKTANEILAESSKKSKELKDKVHKIMWDYIEAATARNRN